ncbi:MAG: hypothetical protein ABI844_10240 [Saprospiraceae bacterium]
MINWFLLFLTSLLSFNQEVKPKPQRYLYVAVPGVRNYLEYGGHGILVFDMDNDHKLVKRIPTHGIAPDGTPENVKGVDVSLATQCIYITTIHGLQCIDLKTEKIKWEKSFDKGCDRLSISPDGKEIYVPSFEKEDWYIIDALKGDIKLTISPNIKAHNTTYSPDGKEIYLEGLQSPYLTVVSAMNPTETRQVGPFSNMIRPFTINRSQTRVYVNANELLGFEIGDLKSGRKISSTVVSGYEKGPVKRHGCPSHGIALNPGETEIWISDAYNQKLHVFDLKNDQVNQKTSIPVKDQPGWITFSLNGQYAYPSTGEVIDAKSKKIITNLKDENGNMVGSEKMLEIDFMDGKAVSMGDQFGLGRK